MKLETTNYVHEAIAIGARVSGLHKSLHQDAREIGALDLTPAALRRRITAEWGAIVQNARRKGFKGAPRLPKAIRILTESTKTIKGEKLGVLTGVAYLAPATEAGRTTCPNATAGCALSCLGHSAGQMIFRSSRNARAWRTALFFGARTLFRLLVLHETRALVARANKLGMLAAVRLDGSSDLGEGWKLQPSIHALGASRYDYTKSASRARVDKFVTLSYSGENLQECRDHLADGGNVAIVVAGSFDASGPGYPALWFGFPTLNGDKHDARFRDPKGHVVCLSPKGAARKDASGFVVWLDPDVPTTTYHQVSA